MPRRPISRNSLAVMSAPGWRRAGSIGSMADALAAAPAIAPPAIAETEAEQLLAKNRFDIAALVAKADHRFIGGEHRPAAAFYSFAVKCAAARGVPDSTTAEAARRAGLMREWLADRFRHHIVAGLEDAGLPI